MSENNPWHKLRAKFSQFFSRVKISSPKKYKHWILGFTLFVFILGGLLLVDNLQLFDKARKLFVRRPEIDASYYLVYAQETASAFDSNTLPITAPFQVKSKENPINGVMMTEKDYREMIQRHPVAVTVNNHSLARHQHGLSQADVVLEVLTEGGITRYVPIFYQNNAVEKIGPVRSLRYYMIEFASGYADAIIVHHGWAGYDNAPFETYRERADARGAVFKWGIKAIQTAPSAYRDLDKAKKSGYVHSLYTDSQRINAEIERLGNAYKWKLGGETIEKKKFKFDEPLTNRGEGEHVTIYFLSLAGKEYAAEFVYDKNTNTYLRSVGGKADIDLITNKQIAPKNVVIEWHNYGDAQDGHSRVIIDMIGEDKVIILRDGKRIEGTWKKECRTCMTKYYDAQGEEIELVRGQIWIVNAVKVGDRLVSKVEFN